MTEFPPEALAAAATVTGHTVGCMCQRCEVAGRSAAMVRNVRQLHRPSPRRWIVADLCTECSRLADHEVPWPCPTIRALDGEGG